MCVSCGGAGWAGIVCVGGGRVRDGDEGVEGVWVGVVGVGEEGRGWRRRHQTVVGLRGIETPGAFTDRVSAIPAPAVSAVFRPNRRPSLLSLSTARCCAFPFLLLLLPQGR